MRLIFFIFLWCFVLATIERLPTRAHGVQETVGSDGRQSQDSMHEDNSNRISPKTSRRLLIVGGSDAPEDRFPYACSLRQDGSLAHECAGVLIAPKTVLTIARCVSGPESVASNPVVYVGAYGIDGGGSAEAIPSVKAYVHEGWTGDIDDGNDIALVFLEKESTKTTLRLPEQSHELGTFQIVTALGWGRTSQFSALPDVLQMADQLEYIDNDNCQNVWPDIKDSMMCAHANSQSPCQGDSGGPLIVSDGDPSADLLVGLVSYGPDDCGETPEGKFKPVVFTRVASFREWIDEKMEKESGTSSNSDSPTIPPEAESPPRAPTPTMDEAQKKTIQRPSEPCPETMNECCEKKESGCKCPSGTDCWAGAFSITTEFWAYRWQGFGNSQECVCA